MEIVDNLDKLVDYPVGAIVNLQCPEYNGIVRVTDSKHCYSSNIAPCDSCCLKSTKYPCYESCCVEYRKDHTDVFFKLINVRSVNTIDELATCKEGEPVHVSTSCFEGYVRACICHFDVFNACRDCAFNSPFTPCAPCCASQRKDGEEVYFEKI